MRNEPHTPMHIGWKIGLTVLLSLALFGGLVCLGYWLGKQPTIEPTARITTTATVTQTSTPTTPNPVPSASATTYETSALTVIIPAGWTAAEAKTRTNTGQLAPNPAAVNISHGKFILYINADQTFDLAHLSNIFEGTPSADAVIDTYPDQCGTASASAVFLDNYPREDWYIGASDKRENCHVPADGVPAWYFSYILYGADGQKLFHNKQLVVTMAYDAGDVDALPKQHDASLEAMLTAMTDIAKTITLK